MCLLLCRKANEILQKLQINLVVEDEKISLDELQELIAEDEVCRTIFHVALYTDKFLGPYSEYRYCGDAEVVNRDCCEARKGMSCHIS